MMQFVIEAGSEVEMIQLGELLGRHLQPGNLLFLSGDLGAGKTTLTKGIARGLGIDEPVTSPTFQLIKHYEGRYPLNHLDLYRLEKPVELDVLEPEELVTTGVTVVEWGTLLLARLEPDYLEVVITQPPGEVRRIVTLTVKGVGYERVVEGLNHANFGN